MPDTITMQDKRGLPQEALKVIACISMIIDHTGAALFPKLYILRVIGRAAFPIYCYLLAEGAAKTKHPHQYAVRLLIGAIISEFPFDAALFGGFTWYHQNVMWTLLTGFYALMCCKKTDSLPLKFLICIPFCFAAEFANTDYGAMGVLMVCMLGIMRDVPNGKMLQCISIAALCWVIPSSHVYIGSLRIPTEAFGAIAIIPICCYHGKKLSFSKASQIGFYLVYPVHLTIIWLIRLLVC